MAGLLEHPKSDDAAPPAPDATPEAPQPEAAVRACATCALPLAGGQDWCLECGAAQPGRLGGRPGWRAAISVLAITGVLVGGAGAAAYAALTTEAQRSASADAPAAGAPQIAQPPVQVAPEEDADDDEDTPSVDAPDSEDADVPEATGDAEDSDDASADDSSSDVPSGSVDSGTADSTTPGAGATTPAPAAATPIDLSEDAATLYNPLGRPTAGVKDPGRAIDGRNATAWEAPVGPDGRVELGVVVSLDAVTSLSDLEFRVNTPGITVEVYASRADEPPPDILDARWEHPASQRDSDVTESVALDGRYRHVLLWVTRQPADTKAAIAEIQLFNQ